MHRFHVDTISKLVKLKDELHEIYATQIMYSFALSLIGVFVPIYLLIAGFQLPFVLMFLAMFYFTLGAISPLIGKLSKSIGLKHSILYSIPIQIAYYFFLTYAGVTNPVGLLALAVVGGFSSALYWNPLNTEFVKNADKLHRGEEVGHFYAFPKFATIFAPIIGGFILQILGFPALFVLSAIIMGIAVFPLFLTKDYKPHHFSILGTFRRAKVKKRMAALFTAQGILHSSEFVLWPIYIFLFFGDIISVGISVGIVTFAIALFTIVVGKAADITSRKRIKRIGAIIYATIWLLRMFTSSLNEVFLLSFLAGISYTLINVSIFAKFSELARHHPPRNVALREMFLGIGRIGILLSMFLAALSFEGTFLVASLAAIALILI